MSAQIINLKAHRRPASSKVVKRKRRVQHRTIEADTEHEARLAQLMAKIAEDERIDAGAVPVRCVVDGRMFEVLFAGGEARRVSTVSYRKQQDRLVAVKHRCWIAGVHREPPDPAIVAVARAARLRPSADCTQASLDQLRGRRARLLRQIEKVDELIAMFMQSASA
jgi:hypothetical protein